MKLSENFSLAELIPSPPPPIPLPVIEALSLLCSEILQPVRSGLDMKIRVTSGWRPKEYNKKVGGVPGSDHGLGLAADIQGVEGEHGRTWETNTTLIADWIRDHLNGHFGQLILEDHRKATRNNGKLWVHVSLPTLKHPGINDRNRLLVSTRPGLYEPWPENLA